MGYKFSSVCVCGKLGKKKCFGCSSDGNFHWDGMNHVFWSNYRDLTRPDPKWWFSKGNPLISGKSRLVKYYSIWPDIRRHGEDPKLHKRWKWIIQAVGS